MINIENYKPHNEVTKDILRNNNFKYVDRDYLYRFPVFKHKKVATLWCNIYINLEHNCCGFIVTDSNFNTYPAFFDRTYGGTNKVVETVEKKIKRQLDKFVKSKFIKKRGIE